MTDVQWWYHAWTQCATSKRAVHQCHDDQDLRDTLWAVRSQSVEEHHQASEWTQCSVSSRACCRVSTAHSLSARHMWQWRTDRVFCIYNMWASKVSPCTKQSHSCVQALAQDINPVKIIHSYLRYFTFKVQLFLLQYEHVFLHHWLACNTLTPYELVPVDWLTEGTVVLRSCILSCKSFTINQQTHRSSISWGRLNKREAPQPGRQPTTHPIEATLNFVTITTVALSEKAKLQLQNTCAQLAHKGANIPDQV